MTTALDAAKYLLTLDDVSSGDLTSNLKLQKLLYYAQGLHLALHNAPLFDARIEAWQHGPVCPPVYHEFKRCGSGAVDAVAFDVDSLSQQARDVLDEAHTVYGQFSAWRLRELTHAEPPWRGAYDENASPSVEISHDALRTYFLTQLR